MTIPPPARHSVAWAKPLELLDEARRKATAAERLLELRRLGEGLGDRLRGGPKVLCVRSIPLGGFPMPASAVLGGAVQLPWPFVVLGHRALLIQMRAEGRVRTLLFNPLDPAAARRSVLFERVAASLPAALRERLLRSAKPIEQSLAEQGVAPEAIDLIAFSDLRFVDLRPLLGSNFPHEDGSLVLPRFPNAKLLTPTAALDEWREPHPIARSRLVADGLDGVPSERMAIAETDLLLGEGCALVQTPGRFPGHQTLFVRGERGVFACSGNGEAIDAWMPYESSIPGLRRYCRTYGLDVLPSPMAFAAADQVASMIFERSVVDRVESAPAFPQVLPSFEVRPSWLSLGIRPALVELDRTSGGPITASEPRAEFETNDVPELGIHA